MKGVCLLLACMVAVLCVIAVSPVAAETWEVLGYASGPTFTLQNSVLTLSNQNYFYSQLVLSGDWAVCGYIDGDNVLHRDPYATFVYNTDRTGGYVQWTNRPDGYGCNLLLGYSFVNCGASTYSNYNWVRNYGGYPPYSRVTTGTVTGNIVLQQYYDDSCGYGTSCNCVAEQKSFFVSPEPSSVLTLLFGITGLGGMFLRKRSA